METPSNKPSGLGLSLKQNFYMINITVIEGRHFPIHDGDSVVRVEVGTRRKYTAVRKKTDSPFFNEAMQPRSMWKSRKVLGVLSLDVASIWNQPNHIFYHKWGILSKEGDVTAGPKGYLKVDVSITTVGETYQIPENVTDTNEIEGNLLSTDCYHVENQRATYIFKVYRADGCPTRSTIGNILKCKSFYIQIWFAGCSGKTNAQKNENPVWNECIRLVAMFPPLCQQVRIELRQDEPIHSIVLATHYINMRDISDDSDEGFLPTFGPTFIYFYNKQNEYMGRLLLSIETEVIELAKMGNKKFTVESIPPIIEKNYWKTADVLLFCTIYEANNIHKRFTDKHICFELSMGPKRDGSVDDKSNHYLTSPFPISVNETSKFIQFGEKKPCLFFISQWPDHRYRILNSNLLAFIHEDLKTSLEEIEKTLQDNEPTAKTNEQFSEAMSVLQRSCRLYIDITNSRDGEMLTDLDKKRREICLEMMNYVIAQISSIPRTKFKKRNFRRAKVLLQEIESFIEDTQGCWPDVFLWMIYGSKRVGFFRVPCREVAFSVIDEELGSRCSVISDVFVLPLNCSSEFTYETATSILAHLRVFFWLGITRQQSYGWEALPPKCCLPKNIVTANQPPTKIICEEEHTFQCRAHIYQGRVNPTFETAALCNPMVRVHFQTQSLETKILKDTLEPEWDQTLALAPTTILGTREFTQEFPPTVLIEIYDVDTTCGKSATPELQGRASATPIVKLLTDAYLPPKFPPSLKWISLKKGHDITCYILVAFELFEVDFSPQMVKDDGNLLHKAQVFSVPTGIRPVMAKYRIEVLFWGVRRLGKILLCPINKPRISISIMSRTIHSTTITNAKKHLNFPNGFQFIDLDLPLQEEYSPPITIRIYDCRSFGRYAYIGTTTTNIKRFTYHPMSMDEYNSKRIEQSQVVTLFKKCKNKSGVTASKSEKSFQYLRKALSLLTRGANNQEQVIISAETENLYDIDWWTKYFASVDESSLNPTLRTMKITKIKIFNTELESQKDYHDFRDLLSVFNMYRGKCTGDDIIDDENIIAVFKGALQLYRWPPTEHQECVTETGAQVKDGILKQSLPINEPVKYIVRIYVVKGINLKPHDINGRSDPYLILKLGNSIINDKKNAVKFCLNPIFGRFFEFDGTFPQDYLLEVQVWDFDVASTDDLIGETKIDLENRFYSNHRASCGLSAEYKVSGYNAWRDQLKPSQILLNLCHKNNIAAPVYSEYSINIGPKVYTSYIPAQTPKSEVVEILSLTALHNWHEMPLVGCHLVPEHVETRSLYNPTKPGLEQGKLQLWIDLFIPGDIPCPRPVDIKPRSPVSYELRVIIWNTENVLLNDDDFFTGEKMSDIYIKGWLTNPQDYQKTDVHYHSLSGEGNFNWRFVFPFEFLATENKMAIKQKDDFTGLTENDFKLPCILHLQIWDNDTFTADDHLGSLTLELSRMPRGARSARACKLFKKFEKTANHPMINLFKLQRARGWWPAYNINKVTGKKELAGKVELELHLMTMNDAIKMPAGLGRDKPQALPNPNRPDTSFSKFKNPLKAIKYTICHNRIRMAASLITALILLFVILGLYSVPGYSVKKLMGA